MGNGEWEIKFHQFIETGLGSPLIRVYDNFQQQFIKFQVG